MRARLAFGLVVILAVGAIAGWRLASPAATATQTITKPHATGDALAPPATHIAAVNPLPVGGEGLAVVSESPKPKPKPTPSHSTRWPLLLTFRLSSPAAAGSSRSTAAFGGSSLNTSQWDTCYPDDNQSGCTNSGNDNEFEWYQPSQVSVGGGTLNLTASSESTQG